MAIYSVFIRSLEMLFDIIEILVIVRVFMNIFRISQDNTIVRIIHELTEPIMYPATMILNKLGLNKGMIDFSPWVALILLRFIQSIIMGILGV